MRSKRGSMALGVAVGVVLVLATGIGVLALLLNASTTRAAVSRAAATEPPPGSPEGRSDAGAARRTGGSHTAEARRVADELVAAANARDLARFRRVLCDPSGTRAEDLAEIAPQARFTLLGDPVVDTADPDRAHCVVLAEVGSAAEEVTLHLVRNGSRWCVTGGRTAAQ
ncbi:hypothetical protein SAMN06265360_119105 [Haloechinothrix alba]|uniref:DUF4878 domain-containing protein n=1 Tax=Haloechinothrix alba TaxID=664784 RepID=A0A238Z999_9PSEU|nr:hypothetical protein [Haloechinothrix alba]SNR79383.1 hypothetical protein SAMN06265360_119105 [Haloechinothrix alba]